MAKQSSKVRNEIQNEGRRIGTEHDDFLNQVRSRQPQATQRGNDLFDRVSRGYDSVLNRNKARPDFSGIAERFKNFGTTGGLSDENRSRIRGSGVYDEFSRTGGVSDEDKSNLRSRTASGVASGFQALKNRFKTANLIGGSNPSYGSGMERLSRDASREKVSALNESELGIMDRVSSGRKWGTEGLSDAERDLAGIESANKRFGMSGELDAVSRGSDFDYKNAGLDLDAIGGLQNLRGQIPAEEFELLDQILRGIGQRGGLTSGNLGQRAQYDPNVSWWDRGMGLVNTIGNNLRNPRTGRVG